MLYFDNTHKHRLNNFTHNIWKSIERFKYKVWIVKRIKSIKCICVDHVSHQPRHDCKRCLGTGNKIKIYNAECVLRESRDQEGVFEDTLISVTPKIAYFKYGTVQIDPDDYIIDLEDIYRVFVKQYLRGQDSEPNTIKCVCPSVKMDSKVILQNFKEVLAEYGYKLQ